MLKRSLLFFAGLLLDTPVAVPAPRGEAALASSLAPRRAAGPGRGAHPAGRPGLLPRPAAGAAPGRAAHRRGHRRHRRLRALGHGAAVACRRRAVQPGAQLAGDRRLDQGLRARGPRRRDPVALHRHRHAQRREGGDPERAADEGQVRGHRQRRGRGAGHGSLAALDRFQRRLRREPGARHPGGGRRRAEARIGNVAREPAPWCVAVAFEAGPVRYALRQRLNDPPDDDATDSAMRCHLLATLQREGWRIAAPDPSVHLVQEDPAHARLLRPDAARRGACCAYRSTRSRRPLPLSVSR